VIELTAQWNETLPEQLPAIPLSHLQTEAGVRLARRYGQRPRCLAIVAAGELLCSWVLYTTPSDYLRPPRARMGRVLDVYLQAVHGPVIAPGLCDAERVAVMRATLAAVRAQARHLRPIAATFVLDPVLEPKLRAAWRVAAASEGFEVRPAYTYVARLPATVDEMFAAIARERRTKVRKAERNGLEFVEVEDLDGVREYHRVRSETRRRTGFEPVPWSHFQQTYETLAGTGIYHVFLARQEGRTGAGQVAFAWNGYVYLSGVSVADWALNERVPANDFLQWNVLRWAVETGQRVVDFVGAQPDSSDPKVQSIDAFKARWGTELAESLTLQLPGSRARRLGAAAYWRLVDRGGP
jgi:hypothetical protein